MPSRIPRVLISVSALAVNCASSDDQASDYALSKFYEHFAKCGQVMNATYLSGLRGPREHLQLQGTPATQIIARPIAPADQLNTPGLEWQGSVLLTWQAGRFAISNDPTINSQWRPIALRIGVRRVNGVLSLTDPDFYIGGTYYLRELEPLDCRNAP